ncbi:MAG: PA14 domain-containing protein, partial [Caldilinea sp.]
TYPWLSISRAGSTRRLRVLSLSLLLLLSWSPAAIGAPLPQVQPPTATVKFSLVNLYRQPSQAATVVGAVVMGESCPIEGRNDASSWLLLRCETGRGWIDRRLVNVTGNLDTVLVVDQSVLIPPPVQPTPTPTAAPATPPATFTGWKVSYFDNPNLQGAPVAYDDVQFIDFRWGYGSPRPAVPVDYFSARFERTLDLPRGYYQFSLQCDDGVRLWLNDRLLIDEWRGATGATYSAGAMLSGRYTVRIEYLELVGLASIRFDYTYAQQEPPWMASYFEGAPRRGTLLRTQRESAATIQLDHNWGFLSPIPAVVPVDTWSAQWVGQFPFEGGNYIFRARADDGVRVYLNQTLVIDSWRDGYNDSANRFLGVGGGRHTVTVEYYDRAGQALLQVWWYRDTTSPGVTP